jgi:hypothetical protein
MRALVELAPATVRAADERGESLRGHLHDAAQLWAALENPEEVLDAHQGDTPGSAEAEGERR